MLKHAGRPTGEDYGEEGKQARAEMPATVVTPTTVGTPETIPATAGMPAIVGHPATAEWSANSGRNVSTIGRPKSRDPE